MSFLRAIFNELRLWFFPKKNPQPNLGLLGDLDDVEMVVDIEQIFNVQFSDEETLALENVGDFFDVTAEKLRQTNQELSWIEFVSVLEPHGTMPAQEIQRETEFLAEI